MKQTSAELKRTARENLNGHWGTMIGANVLSGLILYGILMVFYMLVLVSVIAGAVAGIVVSTIVMIAFMLGASILMIGIMSMHLKLARGQEVSVGMMFSQFTNRPMRYILSGLLLGAIGLGCMLPGYIVIIIGAVAEAWFVLGLGTVLYLAGMVVYVILVLKFGLVSMLFIDDRDMGVIAAYKESSRLMSGNKGRMFYISLSFIGWSILGMLSCGIGMLWVIPYMYQTSVEFYLDVKGELDQVESDNE